MATKRKVKVSYSAESGFKREVEHYGSISIPDVTDFNQKKIYINQEGSLISITDIEQESDTYQYYSFDGIYFGLIFSLKGSVNYELIKDKKNKRYVLRQMLYYTEDTFFNEGYSSKNDDSFSSDQQSYLGTKCFQLGSFPPNLIKLIEEHSNFSGSDTTLRKVYDIYRQKSGRYFIDNVQGMGTTKFIELISFFKKLNLTIDEKHAESIDNS